MDESFNKLPKAKGKPSVYAPGRGYDPNSIRLATKSFLPMATTADTLSRALLLSHIGTTTRTNRRQRVVLVSHTLDVLKDILLPFAGKSEKSLDEVTDEIAQFLARFAASTRLDSTPQSNDPNNADGVCDTPKSSPTSDARGIKSSKNEIISPALHESSLSFITTIGGIAGSFDAELADDGDDENKPYSFSNTLCIKKFASPLNFAFICFHEPS